MKKYKHTGRHIILTNGTDRHVYLEPEDGIETAYPDELGRITGSTEDSVFSKVFNNPARNENGRYHIPDLNPKAKAVLQALFED